MRVVGMFRCILQSAFRRCPDHDLRPWVSVNARGQITVLQEIPGRPSVIHEMKTQGRQRAAYLILKSCARMIMRRKSLSKQAKRGAISYNTGQNIGKGEWRTEPGQEVERVR